MKELSPMKKRAAPVKLTEPKVNITKKGNNAATNPNKPQTSRLAVARSNRIPVANSPAKPSATSYLIASSIFEDDGDTSLLEEEFLDAAKDGDFASVERLLGGRSESLFNVNVRDKETGNTALIWAAKRGHKKIVELLLRHNADITLRNFDGQTALETASPAIQELLVQSVDKGGVHRNLLQAAWQGDTGVVSGILKDCQVDINCKNEDGLTPLLLVTRDVQLFEKFKEKYKKVYNPLEVISILIDNRADPHATDPEGRTALHYACTSKAAMSMDLVNRLMEGSSLTDVQDGRCNMPIHCAAKSGNSNIVVALIDGGTDANVRGFAGATPLHISALNGHDLVCGVLLSKGADVTLVDDSGLTAVEVAKNKKVKATLKQAWAEATEKKGGGSQLNPVRPPSRGDQSVAKGILTRSKSFNYGNKRKGEVIFDSLQPTGSFENVSKKAHLLSNADKSKLAEDRMLRESTDLGTAPFASLVRGNSKISPRSQSRSPSRSPPTARKLAPIKVISPRRQNGRREIKFGPGTKSYDGNPGGSGGSGKFQPYQPGLKKCPSDPAKFGGGTSGLPITVVGFELDEHTKSWRSQSFPARKGHLRQGSDPFTSPTPTPSEGTSLAEEFCLRGRSPSHMSVVSMSEDWDISSAHPPSSSPPNRLSPLKTPLTTPRVLLTDSQDDIETILREKPTQRAQVLSLERMQITNRHFSSPALVDPGIYPNSKKLLPPTPVHLDHPTEPDPRHPTSKENSPRSDEEMTNTTRCKSVLRDGHFRIEDTQVSSSNDSGLPEDKSSSKSSSVNSSMSTLSNGSPRNNNNQEPATKASEKQPAKTRQEVVIKIDGKPTTTTTKKSHPVTKQSKEGFKSGAKKLEHSLSTQEIEDKYLDRLTHSNSTSALSSLVNHDVAEHTTSYKDGNCGLKSKRNTSFSSVRENTGFLKVDKTKASSSSSSSSAVSKSGSSSSSSHSGVRRSLDSGQGSSNNSNSSGGVARNSSISNSKDCSKQQGQGNISAKLRSVAQDNAASKEERVSVEVNKDLLKMGDTKVNSQNSVVRPAASSGSPIKSAPNKGGASESRGSAGQSMRQQNQVSRTVDRSQSNSEESVSRTRTGQTSGQANLRVDLKSSRHSGVASSTNAQPQVMQLKSNLTKDTKDKSNGSIAQAKTTGSTSVSISQSKMASASSSVRTSHVQSSRERSSSSQVTKVIHVQEAVDSSPHPTPSGIETPASRTVSGSTATRNVAVTGKTGTNTSRTGVSNTGGTNRQTSGPISTGARSNPSSRSVSSNVRTSRQNSVPVNSNNTQKSKPSQEPESAMAEPSHPLGDKSSKVDVSKTKTTGLSAAKNKTSDTKVGSGSKSSSSSVSDNLSKPKSSYTTTMTVKLNDNSSSNSTKANAAQTTPSSSKTPQVKPTSMVQNINITKDVPNTGDVSPKIFNQGEAPVAPPRRKRSGGSRPESTGSYSSNGSESPPIEYGDNYMVSKTGALTSLSVNTLKHGVTPVCSANLPSATGISSATKDSEVKKSPPACPPPPVTNKQVTVKGSSDRHSQVNVKLANSKGSPGYSRNASCELNEDHTGPTIVDPFESLNERRRKDFEEMVAREREAAEKREQQPPRSAKSRTVGGTKKPDAKGKVERQGSAGKGRTKTRQKVTVGGEESKKRPKSSKKRRKGKKGRENTNLTENADSSNVALIGGIGWHIETGCNDKTDVQAVTLKDSSDDMSEDSEDDEEEEEINITLHSDFLHGGGGVIKGRQGQTQGQRELTILFSGTIPGQVSDSEEEDSDFEDIPENVEIVHDEVQYVFGEGYSSRSKLNTDRNNPRNSVRSSREEEFKSRKVKDTVVNKEDPDILPQTNTALDKFDRQVSEAELDDILGSKFPKLYGKTNRGNCVPAASAVNSGVEVKGGRTGRAIARTDSNKKATKIRRNNSMPAERKEVTPRIRTRTRHPSISESIDPETDEMIAEILKSTPNPSLSMDSVRNSRKKAGAERGMSREEFEDIINNGGQKSFRELQNSADRKPGKGTPRRDSESEGQLTARQMLNEPYQGEDDIVRMVRNRSNAELQELIQWKNKVDDLNDLERKHLDKLLNTVKNLGLKVGDSNRVNVPTKSEPLNPAPLTIDEEDQKLSSGVRGKPPLGPGTKPSEKHAPEKSPRFVRKRESYRAAKEEVFDSKENPMFPMDSMDSFGSINIPSLDSEEATLVDDRSVVVTSRLGRRSAASSRATVMSEDGGDTIQWKRGNILGKGAYGVVWCGLTNHGGLIAVKQIELNIEDMERTELEYEKIQQEVELLKTLKHRNIVGYLGTSLEDNVVSIFMQFVPGGSIANILARFGALEEEVFSNYTQQILQGVEYLHANNVIHRDIKGGNIMLMPDGGVIKLIDFGCAKRLCLNVSTKVTEQSKKRLLKSMKGTPYWMAPEVVKETGYGTSSDIWSIGCTVHEMATRKPPWADMPQMTAIFSIGNDSKPVPELPEKCTPEARDFARQCMTRDPNRRPSATQLLQHMFMKKRKKSRSNSFANVSEMR